MQPLHTRPTRIRDQQTLETAIIRLPHSAAHAHVRGHARDDQVHHAPHLQQQLEISVHERRAAGLLDHGLPEARLQLGDDGVAFLAAHQVSSHRARIADAASARVLAGAEQLARGEVGEVGAVAFAREEDGERVRAR